LIGLGLGVQAFWVEPDALVVREYELALPNWPRSLNGFRIAAVGDVHGGAPFIDRPKLEEMARRVSAAQPDLVVWLGDYVIQGVVGGRFMDPETVASILRTARGKFGQFAILGNHDRWLDPNRVERAFSSNGIPVLRWQSRVVSVNGATLHVAGLDDFELSPDYWKHFEAARNNWLQTPTGEPLLVLSHNPDVFPWVPGRVDLTLAAHTHAGQVTFPLLGSLIVPSSFGQRFVRGHIVEEGRHLFVNPGIGTSIIPVRFGVPPEISVLTLRAAGTSRER